LLAEKGIHITLLFFRGMLEGFEAEVAAQFGKVGPVGVVVRIRRVHMVSLPAVHHFDMGFFEKPEFAGNCTEEAAQRRSPR